MSELREGVFGQIELHNPMGNTVFVEVFAERDEAVLGVKVERVGLGMQLSLTKTADTQMLKGRFNHRSTNCLSARLLEYRDALDLGRLIADRAEPKRADRLTVKGCEQMIGLIVQSIEFQGGIDALFFDEYRFTYGKRGLSLPIFCNMNNLRGVHYREA